MRLLHYALLVVTDKKTRNNFPNLYFNLNNRVVIVFSLLFCYSNEFKPFLYSVLFISMGKKWQNAICHWNTNRQNNNAVRAPLGLSALVYWNTIFVLDKILSLGNLMVAPAWANYILKRSTNYLITHTNYKSNPWKQISKKKRHFHCWKITPNKLPRLQIDRRQIFPKIVQLLCEPLEKIGQWLQFVSLKRCHLKGLGAWYHDEDATSCQPYMYLSTVVQITLP